MPGLPGDVTTGQNKREEQACDFQALVNQISTSPPSSGNFW